LHQQQWTLTTAGSQLTSSKKELYNAITPTPAFGSRRLICQPEFCSEQAEKPSLPSRKTKLSRKTVPRFEVAKTGASKSQNDIKSENIPYLFAFISWY
jgi:hypothetical protein